MVLQASTNLRIMSGKICLRCRLLQASAPIRIPHRRGIHTTGALKKASKVSTNGQRPSKDSETSATRPSPKELLARYSDEDKTKLAKYYTPAQMAAIEAGEGAIDPDDVVNQGTERIDPYKMPYQTDDLSRIVPVIDYQPQAPEENYDPNMRLKTRDELADDLGEWIENVDENSSQVDFKRWADNLRYFVGKEEAERNPISYSAPEIPKGIPAIRAGMSREVDDDIDDATKRMLKQTGLDIKWVRSLRVKYLVDHRVVNQTRMGKIDSMYCLAIAGNGAGLIGIGEGKSAEIESARTQARLNAIRLMQPIPRYENRTIYGDVKVKMGAVEVELMTRPPGKMLPLVVSRFLIQPSIANPWSSVQVSAYAASL